MARDRQLDERISRWLEAEAPGQMPDRVLRTTFERTRKSRQHLGWRAPLGRWRVNRLVFQLGGAAAVVVLGAVALGSSIGGQATPSPTPAASATVAPSPSVGQSSPPGYMWPQTSLEEVHRAQELAAAGDPRYTWQVAAPLVDQIAQNHPYVARNPGGDVVDAEIFARFLEEELGWDEFLWDEAFAHRDNGPGEVVYIRCARGLTNRLYPADSERAGCAPTIDELRYETVQISVAQLDRQGPSGIWVVTGWEMVEPVAQADPRVVEAEATALLEAFLQARIDRDGADELVDFGDDAVADVRVDQEIPLLYASSTGAPYERSELELVDGPTWPRGGMQFEVRLFAEDDETVVEQVFSLERDETGRLRLVYDISSAGPVPATTENGKAVPVEYAFLDGEVTYRVAHPLEPSQDGYRDRLAIVGLLPDDDAPRQVLLMLADPRPIGPGCADAPAPPDAEALAQSIESDPDFQTSAPVAVTIGGTSALRMDVVVAPGASCRRLLNHASFPGDAGDRARLYLIDLPGGSARVLAIAIITDDDSFEPVLAFAAPIVDSIEFHTP